MIEKKFKIFEIIFLYSVKTAEIMFYNNIERRYRGHEKRLIAI